MQFVGDLNDRNRATRTSYRDLASNKKAVISLLVSDRNRHPNRKTLHTLPKLLDSFVPIIGYYLSIMAPSGNFLFLHNHFLKRCLLFFENEKRPWDVSKKKTFWM